MNRRREEWRGRAACRGKPSHWFFPERSQGAQPYKRGKEICANCSVKEECLALAEEFLSTGDKYGLFGGLTPAERRVARRVVLNQVLWKGETW